jgi:2-polyprenyl-3-methyl-5-hydroxy-6-metoxy-1,4-benzoquinol methylase
MLCNGNGLSFVHNLRDDKEHWAARCNVCGHIQITPLPTVDEDERYYKEIESHRRFIPKSEMDDLLMMKKYEILGIKQVDLIKKILTKDKTILEIGSGYGWFVEKMRADGYLVEGIELNDEKCSLANKRAKIQLQNINILRDDISYNIGKFDAICMFQVFEHILNPVMFLQKIREFVKEGGVIIIEVPNFNAYIKRCSKEYNDFQYLRPHCSYFTPETLTMVLNMANFTDIHVLGEQIYSVENAIHWMRNKEPCKSICQVEMPNELIFINDFYKQRMEEQMISDNLVAIGRIRR